jgi:hypothetical protein
VQTHFSLNILDNKQEIQQSTEPANILIGSNINIFVT